MNIGLAKVSTNAYEAIRYGYLRETDTVIFNTEKRVEIALKRAQYEALHIVLFSKQFQHAFQC